MSVITGNDVSLDAIPIHLLAQLTETFIGEDLILTVWTVTKSG